MIRRRRWWLAAALAVAGAVVAVMVWVTQPPQFSLSLRPVRPLTTAACAAEAHQYGYSLTVATTIMCPTSAAQSWYHAVLINRGGYTLVNCSATGYDARGKVIYHGLVPFSFAGLRGLFAGHGTTTFYWYLPQSAAAPVQRYSATCSVNPWPN